jgi:acyl-CoA reductase-like NAD-dependent aldehyde dehydrogenase
MVPWVDMLPAARPRLLYRIGTLIREHAAELAEMETLDCGKPISQARADIETSAQYFEYYAGVVDKLFGATIAGARLASQPQINHLTLTGSVEMCVTLD